MQPCGSSLHPKVCARCPALLTTYHLHLEMSQSVSPEAFWRGLAAAAAPRVLAGQTGSQTLPCNLEQVMSPAICAGRGGCLAGRQCGGVTLDQTRCRAPLRAWRGSSVMPGSGTLSFQGSAVRVPRNCCVTSSGRALLEPGSVAVRLPGSAATGTDTGWQGNHQQLRRCV